MNRKEIQDMSNHTNQLMTIAEVRATLRIGASTIWRKVKEGSFPAPIKIGGSTRWQLSDVEVFVASLTTNPSKPDLGGKQISPQVRLESVKTDKLSGDFSQRERGAK